MSASEITMHVSVSRFRLGSQVTIRASGRRGEVSAVLFEAFTDPQYRVSFLSSAGDVTRDWFAEDELVEGAPAEAAGPLVAQERAS